MQFDSDFDVQRVANQLHTHYDEALHLFDKVGSFGGLTENHERLGDPRSSWVNMQHYQYREVVVLHDSCKICSRRAAERAQLLEECK